MFGYLYIYILGKRKLIRNYTKTFFNVIKVEEMTKIADVIICPKRR